MTAPANPTISGLAPAKLNTTVLAIQDLTYTPNVQVEPFRSDGALFASIARVAGAAPAVRFRTPFGPAYSLIGLKFLKLTACEIALATFADIARTANGTVWSLATDAIGVATITGASVGQGGLLMADVQILFASAADDASPLSATTAAYPALAGLPTLHTLGPVVANGTTLWGVTGWSVDLANEIVPIMSDGRKFPSAHAHRAGSPRAAIDHQDVTALWTQLGDLGLAASGGGFVLYARAYSGGVITTTGVSISIASGRANLVDWNAELNSPPRLGVAIEALSSNDTHPMAVSTGATIPTT